MRLFLDTSSIFKLYHYENDTQRISDVISDDNISEIFLSELNKIEFNSTIWKKVRTTEFTELQRKTINSRFESDFGSYIFIDVEKTLPQSQRN